MFSKKEQRKLYLGSGTRQGRASGDSAEGTPSCHYTMYIQSRTHFKTILKLVRSSKLRLDESHFFVQRAM